MTTILADFKLGVMVADSSVTDDDRVWSGKKVFRHKGAILGFSGSVDERIQFLEWFKAGKPEKPPKFSESQALVLTKAGLVVFNESCIGEAIPGGIEAIGSGGKAAICAYEALAWTDPVRAVKITCKHDARSRPPVRVYRLAP